MAQRDTSDSPLHTSAASPLQISKDRCEDGSSYKGADELSCNRGSSFEGNSSLHPGAAWRAVPAGEHTITSLQDSRGAPNDVRHRKSDRSTHQPRDPHNHWESNLSYLSDSKEVGKWQASEYPVVKRQQSGILESELGTRRVPPTAPEELSLLYKDPKGQIQGPFKGVDIIGWFEAGYFGIDLPVRLENSAVDSPWMSLGDAMPRLRAKARPPPRFPAPKPNDLTDIPGLQNSNTFGNALNGLNEVEMSKKCMIPTGIGACSGNVSMNGRAQQPQSRGRGRPCNHHPSTSPTMSPLVNVVEDEHSVSVSVGVNVNVSVSVSVSGSKTWQQKSHLKEKKNDPTGMLNLQVANKLNICDDNDDSVSETRTIISKQTHQREPEPFDICPPKQSGGVVLQPPLHVKNRQKRKEMKQSSGGISGVVLRPGMVLLKSYISLSDQVKIVKKCRELGMGRGGFFQPRFEDGTKMHLNMMCLGINWVPQTSQYKHLRPYDGAVPPPVPLEFHELVHAAIRDSRSLIQQHSKTPNSNPRHLVPDISSDICIVNFYSTSGRLGLHQDKDESEKSIRAGVPIVSFSIGDSAEFLYGDERNVDTAKKVILESGDVLIFGGKSRNIFHGVATIQPKTSPSLLLQETNLLPGRLNLTFRQY